ncbi:MAG: GatB/YqeY domain-containing protein [Pseudomonadota bacterium]
MDLKDRITSTLKDALKSKDSVAVSTLRMVNAAIKDHEIVLRGEGKTPEVSEADVIAILGKMVKQRQESAKAYRDGGRAELAAGEEAEIGVLETFLPRQLDDAETAAAIDAAIAETGAETIRDMGKVMGVLKSEHAGQLDMGKVGGLVKGKLG